MNAKHISMVLAAVAVTVGMTSCDKVVDESINYISNLFVPKFDAAKPEESIKAMMEDMDSDQKKQLVAAVAAITLAKGVEGSHEVMDGKTAEEILELAKEYTKKAINSLF
ncbi:MAG: hypothetical protein IJA81_08750 [Akkermansia sp.]|nr:hypothetical protein [Akkermansia sp.]